MEVSGQLQAPATLPPEKEPLGGPQSRLDAVAKKKISFSCQESNPAHPARSPITTLTELSRLPYCHNIELKARTYLFIYLFIYLFFH
jgi:hypothetical protein